jgi:hypothetical protein
MRVAPGVASAIPPCSNHGGKTLPSDPVSSESVEGHKAHIDWLGLTLPIPEGVENVP